jgi:uncharacterized protein with von Willebrand factor type A (vWA) domain
VSRFRYGPWHDGPDPLAPPYDVRGALDEIGRDVLAGGSMRDALSDLLQAETRYAPVVDAEGRIAGVLSVEIISEFLTSPEALSDEHAPAERPIG